MIRSLQSGTRSLIRQEYNRVRSYLPQKSGVFFNVPVRELRLFDTHDTQHEKKMETLVELRQHIRPGDEVVIIGGARGLAAVVAARRVLPDGNVTVYEAAAEQCENTRQTAEYNLVSDYVDVEQAVVGEPIDVWGDMSDAEHIEPEDIPEVSAWVLDIEGGELPFLQRANTQEVDWPELILVETHREKGASPDAVRDELPDSGRVIRRHQIEPAHESNSRDDEVLVWKRDHE